MAAPHRVNRSPRPAPSFRAFRRRLKRQRLVHDAFMAYRDVIRDVRAWTTLGCSLCLALQLSGLSESEFSTLVAISERCEQFALAAEIRWLLRTPWHSGDGNGSRPRPYVRDNNKSQLLSWIDL